MAWSATPIVAQPPYGWGSFDVFEAQNLISLIQKDGTLDEAELARLVAAAKDRRLHGFRDNTWFLTTKGSGYQLAFLASQPVSVVRTIYAEADSVSGERCGLDDRLRHCPSSRRLAARRVILLVLQVRLSRRRDLSDSSTGSSALPGGCDFSAIEVASIRRKSGPSLRVCEVLSAFPWNASATAKHMGGQKSCGRRVTREKSTCRDEVLLSPISNTLETRIECHFAGRSASSWLTKYGFVVLPK